MVSGPPLKRKRSDADDSEDPAAPDDESPTITTCPARLWYRRHLDERFQLQFVGPLPKESVNRIAHSALCYDGNIDDLLTDSFRDPFEQSLRSLSPASILDPIESEHQMQEHVSQIISSHLKLLERLIVRHYFKGKITFRSGGGEQEEETPLFEVKVVHTDSENIGHPTSLRTLAKTGSTPCPHIRVSITPSCQIINENKIWMLNRNLHSRMHATLSVFEIKRQIADNIKPRRIQRYYWHTCAGDLTRNALQSNEFTSSGRSDKKPCTESGISSHAEENVKAKHQADLSGVYSPTFIDEHDPTVDFLIRELHIPDAEISQAEGQPEVDHEELTQVSNISQIHPMSDSTRTLVVDRHGVSGRPHRIPR
jgi:hypothetical protein